MTLEEAKEAYEAYEYLHSSCRFCCWFTGDDTTGCAGSSGYKPCNSFGLDYITAPRWARKVVKFVEEPEE